MSVDGLLDRLHAGAQSVGRGRLRVDSAKALAKLRDFRLARSQDYVLELLRAAVASGARNVDARVDLDELEVSFDGTPFPAALLRDLFGCALSGGADADTVRGRLLAYGVLGALAVSPRHVEVRGNGLVVTVRPPARVDVAEDPTATGPTHVHVLRGLGWRLVRWPFQSRDEKAAIEYNTPYFPATLRLNGEELVSVAQKREDLLAVWERSEEGRELRLGVPVPVGYDARTQSYRLTQAVVWLAVYGVCVTRREIDVGAVPVHGWVRDDGLRRDASGSDVAVDDERFLGLAAAVETAADDMLAELVGRLGGPDASRILPLLEGAATQVEADVHKVSQRAHKLLDEAPLLQGPAGEAITLRQIKDRKRAGQPILVARRAYSADLYDPPVVRLGIAPGLDTQLPQPQKDIEASVQERLRRQRNRARFEAQAPERPVLPDTGFLARAPVAGEGLAGEVGLPVSLTMSYVRFLLGGRLLAAQEVPELSPLRVVAVVDGLSPDDSWLGVRRDAAHDAALAAVRTAAVEAVSQAITTGALTAFLRRHGRDALASLVAHEQPLPEVLRAAPLFDLAGGGQASLDTLDRQTSVRYVSQAWPHAALDELPVVVLEPEHLSVFRDRKGVPKLHDVTNRMRRERGVRERMAGPPETARLPATIQVRTPIGADGVTGELGISVAEEAGLGLTLLRGGVRLQKRRLGTAYGSLVAVVEAPALQPTASWDGVVEDAAYSAVVDAVRAAEPRLIEALVERHRKLPLHALPASSRNYVHRFLERHLKPGAPPESQVPVRLRQAALEGLTLDTSLGRRTLAEVLATAEAEGRLFALPPEERSRLPESLPVVVADGGTAVTLAALARQTPEPPWEELERRLARVSFERLPQRPLELPGTIPVRVAIDEPLVRGELDLEPGRVAAGERRVRGEIGFEPGRPPGLTIDVLYTGRLLCVSTTDDPLPVRAVVDVQDERIEPADLGLPTAVYTVLLQVLGAAEDRMVSRAAEEPEGPQARALLLAALASGRRGWVRAIRTVPIFPTTTGEMISLAQLENRKMISYVSQPLHGPFASGEPVVLAVDPAVREALARAGRRRRNVTEGLAEQIAARSARERLPTVDEVRVSRAVLRRRALSGDGTEGEVGLAAGGKAGIDVYHRHRKLCREELPCPEGVEAAANRDDLRVRARGGGVRSDGTYKKLVAHVLDEVERLAADVAAEWGTLGSRERERLRDPLARVAAWVAERGRRDHPILSLPLLADSRGGAVSVADLLAAQERDGHVRVSDVEGDLLDSADWIWAPGPGQRQALAKVVRLADVSAAVSWARLVRAGPRLASLEVPGAGPWREAVRGEGLEGEVALVPGGLSLELVRDGQLLETVRQEHPVGGRARVASSRLRADPLRGGLARDAAFQQVRSSVESALERLVARVLREGSSADWASWLAGAIAWRSGHGGPVEEALAGVAAFREAGSGEPVTIGRVLAEAAERGAVAVLERGVALGSLPERLVVVVDAADRALLDRLGVRLADLTERAREEEERARRLEERRIEKLTYQGRVLLRHAVTGSGWSGELALPDPADRSAAIVLARNRIAIDRFHAGDLGVGGVLDHPELPVDPDWTRSVIDERVRGDILGFVDELFARLVEVSGILDAGQKETAAEFALRRLGRAGVAAPDQLDRLGAVDDALARAAWLPTASDGYVDVRSVAAHVVHQGPVPVLLFAGPRTASDVLALRPGRRQAAWVDLLESVLGVGCLARFGEPDAWKRHSAERDPGPDDPMRAGWEKIRREASLLRGGALGGLSADVLRDLRLHRADGRTPVRYDAERGLALVDPENPSVARALARADGDPEPLYVLLAAVYGAVNRALDAVTDRDEAHLVAALLGRLASDGAEATAARTPSPS